jgi:Protein of unknown function (DUF1217)
MTTTTTSYLSLTHNLPKMQAMTLADPAVKTASAYYAANIGKVKSVNDFVGNYRLLSYALDAYGLGDQIHSTALMKKVLEEGVSNPKSLANELPQWRAFATAFNFAADGAASVSTPTAITAAKTAYVEQQLETNQGRQNPGVQLALYFKRVAPSVTSMYGILADKQLLQVVKTIFGLSSSLSMENIDLQVKTLSHFFKLSDLSNPAKLQKLTERFTAAYDTTSGASTSSFSPAVSLMNGITSSNSATSVGFSNALLQSLQGLRLGG